MTEEPIFSWRNRWFTTAAAVTATVAVASATVGFLWLPTLQANAGFAGMWDAICGAAGIVRAAPDAALVAQGTYKTSGVIAFPETLENVSASSIGRGATLAIPCTVCHGARGLSEADSPNLAGQYPLATFKQLVDYKSGARVNAVMSPRVVGMSDQDMRDLAAYYAYLPRLPANHQATNGAIPRIVESGAPMRNIAPCATCHGSVDHKAGSAWLEGQSPVYLAAQLRAFASGARHNDISQQMRNVARGMSPSEIDQAARYYADRP